MATQNPDWLGTNCPGGSLTLGGDTTVNRLGFGAMRLCGPGVWGEPLDLLGAKRVLTRAVELGITLIDTADAYGPEVNERFIAETLYPYPEGLIVATKGGLVRPRREAWERNGRPEHLRAACEASLRRLKLERIDIYQLHAPDPQVPLDEFVGALAELQSEGKIRHIGLSNVSVNELRRAQHIAPIVSVQNRYNFSERLSEDVLAECEKGGLAFLPWHPLAAGGDAAGGGALGRVARRLGGTPVQVAIAWLLGRVDGFDQDEAEGERDEGTVIARSLLATKGDALEALEFADGLLDARPRFVEDFREESGSVGCSRAMRNDRTNAALAGAVAIGFGVVTFVGDGGARQNIGSDVEQEFEVAAVAGFAPGQMEGERQAVEVDLEVDFG